MRGSVARIVFVLGCGAATWAAEGDVRIAEWIDGPVRYIALKDEAKLFRDLETDDARALFIERFWARRDPSPGTLGNEYRLLFWDRVTQANGLFTDSSKSGWLTDRGKIFILYGPPADIQEDLHLRTDGVPGGGQGIIRWIYDRPGDRSDTDAIVVVPFVRDGSGEYRVSYDPTLASVFFDPLAIRDQRYDMASRLRAKNAGAGRSTLSVMLDLGKLQEVPPEAQVLLERVETTESYENDPVAVRVDRFERPDDERSVIVLTVDLSQTSPEATPSVIARLAPADDPTRPRILGEDSFRVADGVLDRVAQGRIAVEPGSYALTVLVADPVSAAMQLHHSTLLVPEAGTRLRFSDFVLASALEPVEYRSLVSYDEPYVIGPFRVVPRLGSALPRGEVLKLFYEVYGATPPLAVGYQLEGRETNGAWVALGRPSNSEQATSTQGWELPTSSAWPLGEYRVRVEVADSTRARVTGYVPFVLVDPARSSPASAASGRDAPAPAGPHNR